MDGANPNLSGTATFEPEALIDAFTRRLGGKLGDAQGAFVQQAADDCSAEELPGLGADDLAAILADFWSFAESARGDAPAVRLRRATGADGRDLGRDLVEIVQDDRPFLVDSVMGEIAEAGFSVKAMFHPVVAASAGGKARSLIQVHLDPVGEDRAEALMTAVKATLSDVKVAVDDFMAMRALMRQAIEEVKAAPLKGDESDRAEQLAFLNWLEADHFVFLGARVYDYPRTADGGYANEEPLFEQQGSLGVLRDASRSVLRRANEPAILSNRLMRYLETDSAIVVAKSNLRSRVHRRGYMDYVGVKRYGKDGLPSGEIRFVGLFTVEAYSAIARDVPLIRSKIAHVMARAGKMPGSHSEKRLRNIVLTWPRDELFQMTEDELLTMSLGVLHLHDRPKVKLFARRDPFDRFVSVLLYIPRERYDSDVRMRAGKILAEAFQGRVSAYYPSFSDAPLARVHYILGVDPGQRADPDLADVEARIAQAARTWGDRFEEAARGGGVAAGQVADVLTRYADAFPAGYRDHYDADEALADLAELEAMGAGDDFRARAYRVADDTPLQFHFKLYHRGGAVPLTNVLPILDHMGLRALIEDAFELNYTAANGERASVWVHEFLLEDDHGERLVFNDIRQAFETTFCAVWTGRTESDGFNRLIIELGAPWREAALLRALAKYRQQSGLDPSQAVQEQALADNPDVARLLLDLFRIRFDPAIAADIDAREDQSKAVFDEIIAALQQVESLDHDRVLRRLALLIQATKRTNYYQTDAEGDHKPYISFKVASRELDDLPAPKPFREIFVWAPHVDGVHLRFGPVARGGLRWSDRRDDFRTEVLGLVKAQQVKNAVIVPVGSKGGFYPKQLPRGGTPDAIRAEGIRAYKTFLCGLLDITDNIDADGKVVRPQGVVIHEGDDPYLVVAADKGTATFSDIANGVADDYGFWLSDAFASGGSVGYDHKVMGITARGAWEAVKRHFREAGKDIQTQPFTVVGVGDMSGDVFGNGMLLSKQIRLQAAFDHRHIFLDPDPDMAASWEERKRMFALPRSSWDDYDRAKISKGGGVFARTLKSIPLSPEMRAVLEIKTDAVSPTELMTAILKSKAELLYLGGIGTYVKATGESQADAGDKANDAVRVNGADLRVKVVGEGANLGLTQAGRIEFARKGGRINTDAIDNSAGVDSSDHEVNIKILTGIVERAGKLTRPDRNTLLASMTDEVGLKVLAHNYDQTLALSLMERDAPGELDAQARFMLDLEGKNRLDRKVEGLPDPVALAELSAAGRGLTRPEMAVLLAYGKIDLFDDIIDSTAPDDPYFVQTLEDYFPGPLAKYEDEMRRHRLRREIIATVIDNDIVNRCGPTFPGRLRASAGCDTAALVVGYEAAKQVLRLDDLWSQVAALDGKASATGQMALFAAVSGALRAQTYWLARRAAKSTVTVQALIEEYQPSADKLRKLMPGVLSPFEQKAIAKRAKAFIQDGAPEELAHAVAILPPLTTAADLVDLANASSWDVDSVARLYHQVGSAFSIDRLRAAAGGFRGGDHFERLAVRRLVEDMLGEQTALTSSVLKFANSPQAAETAEAAKSAVNSWAALRHGLSQNVHRTVEEIEHAGAGWSFAKLTIANAAVRELSVAGTAR